METVICLVALVLPAAMLFYLFGYLKGLDAGLKISNWGTGFDDGWKAYKELVIETGRNDNGLDKPGSSD